MNRETTPQVAPQAPSAALPGQPTYRPSLRLYHANVKGTGGAMTMDLHPAHDRVDGSIMAKVASQMAIGDLRGPNPTFPRFDWENAISVKLDFNDLCMILQVFRGECESLEDGHGLVHRTARALTRIMLRHVVDPVQGYSFEVHRTLTQGAESRARIFLSPWEALGLAEAIAGSLSVVCFGIPMVIPHDTSAYEAEQREMRNVRAA